MDAFLSSPVPSRIDDLTDEFVEVTLATADHYAKRIARTLNLPASDIDDVRQDLLVEVLRRSVRYDPTRAAWTTLVELITRHAAGDLATDLMQSRTAEVGSIDDVVVAPDGSRTSRGELLSDQDSLAAIWSGVLDPYAAAEQRIDLERFINRLPDHLRRLCRLLQTEQPLVAQRLAGMSTATFYRELQDLRMRLRAVGLG